MIFSDSRSAYEYALKNNEELSRIDRNKIIKYITLNSEYSFYFLKKRMYINNNERKKILKGINNTEYSIRVINNIDLTKTERKELFNRLHGTYSCYELLLKAKLTKNERIKIICKLMLSPDSTFNFLRNCPNITNEELILVYKYFLNSEYEKTVAKLILKHHQKQCIARERSFMSLFLYPEELLELALSKHLTKEELDRVYQQYNRFFFTKLGRKIYDFLSYCEVFNDFIGNREYISIIRKLKGKNFQYMIKSKLQNMNFPEKYKEELESILILNELKKF